MKLDFWRRIRGARTPQAIPPEAPRETPRPEAIARAYHQQTKHHAHRSATGPGYLDWDTQPDPFRRFEGAERVLLPFMQGDSTPPFEALHRGDAETPTPVSLESIAQLFELSLALSAWKQIEDARWSLRVNPSSGNLHPTEGYAVLGPLTSLASADTGSNAFSNPTVCHYAPDEHAFEIRARFEPEAWQAATAALPEASFFVGLTSIPWRESWKYGERAYRYCQHDIGHALAALRYSAAALGWSLTMLDGHADEQIARMLGLDRDEDFEGAEREHPDLLAVVTPGPLVADRPVALGHAAIEGIAAAEWSGRANRLSPEHIDWEVIDIVAEACLKPATPGESVAQGARAIATGSIVPAADSSSARSIIRQRRSAVDLDGKTALDAQLFFRVLARTLRHDSEGATPQVPFDALPWSPRLHLGLYVHRVEGLPAGLYALVRSEAALERLRAAMREDFLWQRPEGVPEELPLYLLEKGDFRGTAASVSCTQAIAGSGAFSLGMITDLEPTLVERGAWWYRWLHWEAGMIGQVLYLEAEAAGMSGTGIGCFFDDAVHASFGITDQSLHTLYHFTMGRAVEDGRLTTLPPYTDERMRSG